MLLEESVCYDQCHILGQAESCGRQEEKGQLNGQGI